MESLLVLVLVGLAVLAIPAAIVFLLIGQSRLRRRISELEQRLAELRPAAVPASGTEATPSPKTAGDSGSVPERAEEPARTGPWAQVRPAEPVVEAGQEAVATVSAPASPPRAVVFRQERISALGRWLRENWFYAVSALSLALAGIFLVQYGVEKGLLSPTARVFAALTFGAVLIAAGEVVRRRFGDDETSSTAYLPSVFSGAGIVTLFGGVLAARQLYGLIGPEPTLTGMMAIALLGLVLGWYHGPLLAAVGLIGAYAAPFLVGGSSDEPSWLYAYFLIVALLGMGIDTVRRWAWISVLTLVGAYAAAWLLALWAPATEAEHAVFAVLLALAAITVPARRLVPDHGGSMVAEMVFRKKGDPWPEFPTRLAFGAVMASSAIVSLSGGDSEAAFLLAVVLLSGLTIALVLWASSARALQDATLFPAAGLLWVVLVQGIEGGAAYLRFATTYAETPEADYPMLVTALVALAALLSVLAAWRSFRAGATAAIWAGAAAVFAPALAIMLELGWVPARVIGPYPWALHALALGALMVVLTERFAHADGEARMRSALATLSALSCLAFACIIVLSSAALTVALAVTVAMAAALDRKFTLPPMSWFIYVGVVTLGFRLVLDPGLDWAEDAPLPEMLLAYGGTLIGFVLALWLVLPLARPLAKLMLESAAWSTGGLLVSLLLLRWLESLAAGKAETSHWGLGLFAVIWLGLAFAQVQRWALGGRMKEFRIILAVVFALAGGEAEFAAVTAANPLLEFGAEPVLGPPVLNTLMVAYLLPSLVIGFSAWRIGSMPLRMKQACGALAVALSVFWFGLAIRHFWQGPEGMHESNGVTQPELYSYTLALLVIGAALFYQSLARHSHRMRKAGLAVIGLAVAKVFLVDISGLGGLIRVFSLLALGLALAGLAWLNRWAMLRHSPQASEPLDQ
ncbi:hypothetical protein AVO45_04990 [Ruegeria marisrubri]|uniref:Beta-carotene 15,15'-monooxygenase n=1 Tax=Ruegeria marisrubri TaxID=1685379 RepID=A0A0X3U474_9RHOB|nr:DUF2339 domain-containing protein [Ruegeria marisrubri]KUJ80410.1 hypothetical protein AVO45_04990 [Ruegeria marisrubri]